MKTHTIKTPTAELMILELPEGCNLDYTYYSEDNETEIAFYLGEDCVQLKTFKGYYTLLGKPDEIMEDDAEELVEKVTYSYSDGSGEQTSFKHYNSNLKKGTLVVESAKESLLSAIENAVFWENPYDEYRLTMTFTNEYKNRWEIAKEKTFDRNRSIIFKKN